LFEVGNHPDFRLLQPESETEEGDDAEPTKAGKGKRPSTQIPVSSIRSLTSLVTNVSHSGGAKAVVIAPAETLHRSASGALLKMLEEPKKDTHFILVANEAHRILPTISSRCFKLPVSPPSVNDATVWLNQRTTDHVDKALRLSSYAPLGALALSANDEFWLCREALMAEFSESAPDPLRLATGAEPLEPGAVGRLLGTWIYDLLATQAGGDIRYHTDMDRMIRQTAKRVSGVDLCHWSDEVREYTRAASHPLNRRLALESLFAKWPGLQLV
jgi:DNA polymerase-3 subunit delta'